MDPIAFQPVRPRHRRVRAEHAVVSPPPPPPPPPPPALVHVVRVTTTPGESYVATWVFDAAIGDPTTPGPIAGLSIDGMAALSWVRDDDFALRIGYGLEISSGQEWANTAGAGGIVGSDGGLLSAGSGEVEAG